MVRAARAERRQGRHVAAVDEVEHGRPVLEVADLALIRADAGADLRHQPCRHGAALGGGQARRAGAAEGGLAGGLGLEPRDGPVDDAQRGLVAAAGLVAPGEEAVAFQHDALGARVLGGEARQHEAELEAGAAPGQPADLLAVDAPREGPAVARRRDGDHGVGVHVVDVPVGQVGVERRVDRGGARVQREGAVGQVAHHLVLVLGPAVDVAQAVELVPVEGREAVAPHGADVPARALDPEHLDGPAGQRVALRHLGRGVAAAVIGDALVGAEQVRAVEQEPGLVEAGRLRLVPAVLQQPAVRIRHHVLPGIGPAGRVARQPDLVAATYSRTDQLMSITLPQQSVLHRTMIDTDRSC